MTLDVNAYFERIHWAGGSSPTVETLSGLLERHMRYIPFENLDVLLDRPIRLDLDGLQHKLVRERRGGYCFEHTTLFAAVLEQLGFRPVRHSARVVMVLPRTQSPRSHMFLTVPLAEGTFLVDPGFGGLAPRAPMELTDGGTAGIHRLERDGNYLTLRATVEGKPVDLWVSTLEPDVPADFEMANHYTSTHPSSPFRQRLMMRAFTDHGRVAVMNRDVTVERAGRAEKLQLADRAALRRLLVEHFGFDLPEVERLRVPMIGEWSS
jgi:N-hydroxyarylamine O-acetyltransferase